LDVIADVPPGVVTVTVTGPAVPAGAVVVTCLVKPNVTAVAGVESNRTVVGPLRKFAPFTVTVFPPATGPSAEASPVTVGGLA
jgi:hypothetical protein